jgi:hypothetical protein
VMVSSTGPSTTPHATLSSTSMSRYPSHLSVDGGSLTKAQKSRARREPSGVFSLFQPAQIQQFKEAFSLIDQDRDGVVSERDLKEIFASLGAFNSILELAGNGKPYPVRYNAVQNDD